MTPSAVPALPSAIAVGLCLLNCQPTQPSAETPPSAPPQGARERGTNADHESHSAESDSTEPDLPWAEVTFSPRPGSSPEPALEPVEVACGSGDAVLHDAATFVAKLHSKSGEPPSLERVRFHLNRLGVPYVHPRLWSATMAQLDEAVVTEQVEAWSQGRRARGELRCGVGLHLPEQGPIVVSVLQVDVLADVAPVATRVESGARIDFKASLLRPSTAASVVLLPPGGMPHGVETDISGQTVEARLSIDRPGTWLVQLMATDTGGPLPVAQLLVTADETPPSEPNTLPVPGEDAAEGRSEPEDALFAMLNAARVEEGLPPVSRNGKLDRLARAHSEAMRDRDAISHDTGRGDPARRVESAGLHPKAVGENVARAQSTQHLHRVLWASPSHRENLLLRRWDQVGISVIEDQSGRLIATQLFVDDD